MLDKQINLFQVDTNAFLTEEEQVEFKKYIEIMSQFKQVQYKLNRKRIIGEEREEYQKQYDLLSNTVKTASKDWKKYILKSSANNVEYNKQNPGNKRIRKLNDSYLFYIDVNTGIKRPNYKNIISMFESTLSRAFEVETDDLTMDIIVVEIYYYDIAKDLILNGFNYGNKHYVYFSSSAGQIRTKKAVFVNEEKYSKCQNKLMCGLTIDKINESGGMNVNKFLAYLALSNSATDLWEDVFGSEFDIDRTIVVDDFETIVNGKVDYIDYLTYDIQEGIDMDVPIPHSDGCGIIDRNYCKKNFMIRMPFLKGLLGSFDYRKFIKYKGCSSKVKDIWGKEYDIFEDNIQIIFTKSQMKMWKYYSSWEEYKENFKKYGCEAGVCNMEEDKIPSAKINYQMLQTLYDATDEEIEKLCAPANAKIKSTNYSIENCLNFFGTSLRRDFDESKKDYYQKALRLYPEMLREPSCRYELNTLKNSLIKNYKSGKLDVVGKFTFVLPDLYAFCEHLFMGIEVPKGLLKNGEVFCRLYPTAKELDCLRSPHLYIEHAIRTNKVGYKLRGEELYIDNWFETDAIYTSSHDLITKILMNDCDGDRLLVLAQKDIINMAKRSTKDVYPLYYEMKKAKAEILTLDSIWNGLQLAFTNGNIGIISNNISKIWNRDKIGEDEKKAVKWLCFENNETIDYAKTLYRSVRPDYVDKALKNYCKEKVPHFFIYAKNKEPKQVNPVNNSTINRIEQNIYNKRMYMLNGAKKLQKFDYHMLLKNKTDNGYFNIELNGMFDVWNKKYRYTLNFDGDDRKKNNIKYIASQVREDLESIEPDINNILNSLVVYLYKEKTQRIKKLLWYLYGEELYNILKENIGEGNTVCEYCGKRTKEKGVLNSVGEVMCHTCRAERTNNRTFTFYCEDCGKEIQATSRKQECCDECMLARRSYLSRQARVRQAILN